jgi:hypothetical protein
LQSIQSVEAAVTCISAPPAACLALALIKGFATGKQEAREKIKIDLQDKNKEKDKEIITKIAEKSLIKNKQINKKCLWYNLFC